MVRVIGDGVATVATTVPPLRPDDRPGGTRRSRRCPTRATRRRPTGRRSARRSAAWRRHRARCMASVIRMLPWESGPDWLWDPLTWLVNGHRRHRTAPGRRRGGGDVPEAGARGAASPPCRSWWPAGRAATARSRNGGTSPDAGGRGAAKPAMTRVTTRAAAAAAVRRPRGSERPVVIRQAKAPSTAAVQTASTNRMTGSWVSVPVPRAWTSGDGPAEVGEPVDEAPGGVADAVAQAAGDEDGQQEVEGQRAQAHVDRSVGGEERHEDVDQSDGHVAVEHGGGDVDADEHEAEEGHVAVDVLGEEAGPALGGPADRGHDAEEEGGAEQHERHDAAGPGQVPEGLAAHRRRWSGAPGS